MHAECARLPAIPSADWHCPACACAACGHAGFGPRADLSAASGQVPPRWAPAPSRTAAM